MTEMVEQEERPSKSAMLRGMRERCPCCGEGELFTKYLKVVDTCASCGTELRHHRADDGPAYLTITIVGHVVIGIMMALWGRVEMSPLIMSLTLSVLAIAMCLWMLPKMKGLIVGIQWAKRMHGFGRQE